MDDECEWHGVEGGDERIAGYGSYDIHDAARLQPDVHDKDGRSEHHVLRISRRQHDDSSPDVPHATSPLHHQHPDPSLGHGRSDRDLLL